MSECRYLIAMQLCDCVPFNFLRNESSKNCELSEMGCIFNISDVLYKVNPVVANVTLENFPPSGFRSSNHTCSCLPECAYIEYYTELVTAKLNLTSSPSGQKFL